MASSLLLLLLLLSALISPTFSLPHADADPIANSQTQPTATLGAQAPDPTCFIAPHIALPTNSNNNPILSRGQILSRESPDALANPGTNSSTILTHDMEWRNDCHDLVSTINHDPRHITQYEFSRHPVGEQVRVPAYFSDERYQKCLGRIDVLNDGDVDDLSDVDLYQGGEAILTSCVFPGQLVWWIVGGYVPLGTQKKLRFTVGKAPLPPGELGTGAGVASA